MLLIQYKVHCEAVLEFKLLTTQNGNTSDSSAIPFNMIRATFDFGFWCEPHCGPSSTHCCTLYLFHFHIELQLVILVCEPGNSVSIVSGYGLDYRAIGVRFPAEAEGFFL
jgi:hypothetical protein